MIAFASSAVFTPQSCSKVYILKGILYRFPLYSALTRLTKPLKAAKRFTYSHTCSSEVWKMCAP